MKTKVCAICLPVWALLLFLAGCEVSEQAAPGNLSYVSNAGGATVGPSPYPGVEVENGIPVEDPSRHYGPVSHPVSIETPRGSYTCRWWSLGESQAAVRLYDSAGMRVFDDSRDVYGLMYGAALPLTNALRIGPAALIEWCVDFERRAAERYPPLPASIETAAEWESYLLTGKLLPSCVETLPGTFICNTASDAVDATASFDVVGTIVDAGVTGAGIATDSFSVTGAGLTATDVASVTEVSEQPDTIINDTELTDATIIE